MIRTGLLILLAYVIGACSMLCLFEPDGEREWRKPEVVK